jgi:hypothetical protein
MIFSPSRAFELVVEAKFLYGHQLNGWISQLSSPFAHSISFQAGQDSPFPIYLNAFGVAPLHASCILPGRIIRLRINTVHQMSRRILESHITRISSQERAHELSWRQGYPHHFFIWIQFGRINGALDSPCWALLGLSSNVFPGLRVVPRS